LSPAELKRWVLGSEARFFSLDRGVSANGDQLRQLAARGVFKSEQPGIVLLALPPHSDVCEQAAELRQFTLESDLVLGAVATGEHVLLVGRERATSLEQFPPLRGESLLALAATRSGSLAQSFQRLSLMAGKLKSGEDWAPILLSDELQGTEFGSLLNITDQMLKSWSLNGQVTYANFEYPAPPRWADSRPVIDQLSTESLTFNWNTSAATAYIETPDSVVLSVLRTGALPITYIPEHSRDDKVAQLEERYHDYFASLDSPELARVVAYTVMFEVFRSFDLKASCYHPGIGERRGDASLERRTAEFVANVRNDDKKLRSLASSKLGRIGDKLLLQTKSYFADVASKYGDDGMSEFIHYLGSVRGPLSVEKPRPGIREAAMQLQQQRAFGELARAVIDRDAAYATFYAQTAPASSPWLRTPSVVISRAYSKRDMYVEGGHNVDVRPIELTSDPAVRRQEPRVELRRGRPTLLINPADADAAARLQPVLKKFQDGRITPEAAQTEMSNLLAQAPLSSLRSPADALYPKGDLPRRRRRVTRGWAYWPRDGQPDQDQSLVRITNAHGLYELAIPGRGAVPYAKSPLTLLEPLHGFLTEVPGRSVILELVGVSPDQAMALRRTLHRHIDALQRHDSRSSPSVDVVTGNPDVFGETFRASTIVTAGALRELRDGDSTMYQFQLDIKDSSLLMRVALFFKSRVAQPTSDAIRRVIVAVMDRRHHSSRTAARAIRDELRKNYPEALVEISIEKGQSCNYVIADR
jgi:hypothetical protein